MYDQLPKSAKAKVLERARVEQVIEADSTVRVILEDGREFSGDLVVGADGVHSKMRDLMWKNANKAVPGSISVEEQQCEQIHRAGPQRR